MEFHAAGAKVQVFPGIYQSDFEPVLQGVGLRTAAGKHLIENGQERTWPALWDTGGIVTVIPSDFATGLGLDPVNKTARKIKAFDGTSRKHEWYPVRIGLPGLPWFRTRAIAPEDRDPDKPRRHITLGRDVITRLVLSCSSNVPWDYTVDATDFSKWVWRYRRRFPRGLRDVFK